MVMTPPGAVRQRSSKTHLDATAPEGIEYSSNNSPPSTKRRPLILSAGKNVGAAEVARAASQTSHSNGRVQG